MELIAKRNEERSLMENVLMIKELKKTKGHEQIGEYIRKCFKNYKIREEMSYKDIMKYAYKRSNTDSIFQDKFLTESSAQIRADWIILDLGLVIEVNGEQHYEPVRFGGISIDEAEEAYNTQLFLDQKKRKCIKEIGWKLVEIKFTKDRIPTYNDFLLEVLGSDKNGKKEKRSTKG